MDKDNKKVTDHEAMMQEAQRRRFDAAPDMLRLLEELQVEYIMEFFATEYVDRVTAVIKKVREG